MECPSICEAYLTGNCVTATTCSSLHAPTPYVWQVCVHQQEWKNVAEYNEEIELAFCNPSKDNVIITMPVTYDDGTTSSVSLTISFVETPFQGFFRNSPDKQQHDGTAAVRRLSTASRPWKVECEESAIGSSAICATNTKTDSTGTSLNKYLTQWTWYYKDLDSWHRFGENKDTPAQTVLEAKFHSNQEVYRFTIQLNLLGGKHRTCLLDFQKRILCCSETETVCPVRYRPLYISQFDVTRGISLPCPSVTDMPIFKDIPDNWFPMSPSSDYELVPLNPQSMEFHLIASESTHQMSRVFSQVKDIFRLQNRFLWQKYQLKKAHMERHGRTIQEMQLFHGTDTDVSVLSIFAQNFDVRLCGKNATAFGKGIYFAKDASYSHMYTCKRGLHWMFLSRVIVGRYAPGKSSDTRPPPLDHTKPYGELYDSCVNRISNPSVYIIFENDQCYPEYVICYAA